MALECAHCGAHTHDGATRCPQCLRTTGLVPLATQSPRPSRLPGQKLVLVGTAVTTLVVVVLVLVAKANWSRRGHDSIATRLTGVPGIAPSDLPPPFETGPELAPLIAQVRTIRDHTARGRAILDTLTATLQSNGATLVTDPEDTPPARTPDEIHRALRSPHGRVTALDLARWAAAVLRAAGSQAEVAERTRALRDDEPADPSGLLGSYVAILGDHAMDVTARTLVAARETAPRILRGTSLAGAVLAQAALHAAVSGAPRDRVLALAEGAVRAWPDGTVPLAVRALAWQVVGASGGMRLADQDLASAIARRDEAPLHLLRARLALVAGNPTLAATEAFAALRRSPAWGPAALAHVVLAPYQPDAGDRCAPLVTAREPWTDDALALCQRDRLSPNVVRAAAERLAASSHDPLRLAYAAAAGHQEAATRVRAHDRPELAAWLLALGRPDLAHTLLHPTDAGR